MTAQAPSAPVTFPSGQIIAFDVPADQYLAHYASEFCEWVQGTVITMTPVTAAHDRLSAYFRLLLEAYFALKPIGTVLPDQTGHYRTPLLPGLGLRVPTLWQEPLPDFFVIGQAVQTMLEERP